MQRNSAIESVLERELDSLPLPPEDQWLPARDDSGDRSRAAWLIVGTLLITAAVAGPALAQWRDYQVGTARPTLRVPPTLPIGNRDPNAPLARPVSNPALGFTIMLPSNWRESTRGRGAIPGDASLIGRASYTARSPEHEAAAVSRHGASSSFTLPWDITAELWLRNGLSALEWARTRGVCSAPCAPASVQINGVNFITTVDSATGVHAFYVVRGDRVLVFSYIVGTPAERPEGVTDSMLEQTVRLIRLS